ncbi:MAG: hypothetical protein P8Y44_01390, partial [Acidobacteriota bacterium]
RFKQLLFLLLSVVTLLVPFGAEAGEFDLGIAESDTTWMVLGSFRGSGASGWLNRINNWIFEYERDDELFQDLGDIGLGLGFDIDDLEVDWDNFFKRKVVLAHTDFVPGHVINEDDLSHYRTLSRARTRLRLRWNYLPDLVGQFGIGLEVEGGYSLAIARTQESGITSDRAFEPMARSDTIKEVKQFFRQHELNKNSDLIDILFGSIAAVTNKAMGEIGERTADTEKAAIFFDGYAEPMTYLTVSNLPPSPVLFTSDESPIHVGDAITFTTFAGLSPVRAGAIESGLQISLKQFRRFIRETTILRESDTVMLVRVRNTLRNGQELIPIKFRPRIRILQIIKLAYTFFDIKRDSYHQTVSDTTYRIDLENPVALDFFRELIFEAARLQRRPPPLTVEMRPGVETLRSEFRKGRTRDRAARARFFSWARYRNAHITSIHDVQTPEAELQEVIRARVHQLKKPFGKKKDFKSRSVVTTQADVESDRMHEGPETHPGERYATTIETSISAPKASGADIRSLGNNLQTILNLKESHEELEPLKVLPDRVLSGLTFDLLLSFGPDQAERLEKVTETQLWIVLAELLLGPKHRGAWSTAERRFWWRPTERAHGRASSIDRHVSYQYDDMRGFRAVRGRNIGFSPDQYSSRQLFIKASKLVKKFQGIQREIREGDCLKCMSRVFSKGSDIVILQALLVRFAGGVESGEVGYKAEVFSNEMVSPAIISNDVTYTYRHQQPKEILGDVELAEQPRPRLRGGELQLQMADNSKAPEAGLDQGCWRLKLYSDYLFEQGSALRLYLRDAKLGVDKEIMIATLDLGEAHLVPEAPFMEARYYYQIPIPWSGNLKEKKGYSLLIRGVNDKGLPLTEEQEIRLQMPKNWPELVPSECAPEPVVEVSGTIQAALFDVADSFASAR